MASGERAGFLIGDGAGVGKGRTIAGIMLENFLQGRKKSIWVCIETIFFQKYCDFSGKVSLSFSKPQSAFSTCSPKYTTATSKRPRICTA